MITVKVGNSFSKIKGLSEQETFFLKDKLSYIVGGANAFYTGFVRRKSFLKENEFPTGLLSRVLKLFPSNSVQFEDDRNKNFIKRDFQWKNKITPYEAQVNAIRLTEFFDRGIISMPTGSGKSHTIAMLIKKLAVKTLIIVPNVGIRVQLLNSLKECFTSVENITVLNIDSPLLKKELDYDCLIIDEAHHVAASTYQKLNKKYWKNIYHRYFFTATPFRNNAEETLLFEAIAGDLIFELSFKDAVRNKYIMPVDSYYIEIEKEKNDFHSWQEVYKNLVVLNKNRNEKIINILKTLMRQNKVVLCLVKEIEHGAIISKVLDVPFVNGQDENTKELISKFNAEQIKTLIGTAGVIGEGIDTKACEYVIIAGAGKAKSAFMQQIGRCIRPYLGKESGKVIIIKDTSHKFLSRHFKEQCKILKEEYISIPSKLVL